MSGEIHVFNIDLERLSIVYLSVFTAQNGNFSMIPIVVTSNCQTVVLHIKPFSTDYTFFFFFLFFFVFSRTFSISFDCVCLR